MSGSRELTSHRVRGLNNALVIEVADEPGAGGACHEYRVGIVRVGQVDAVRTLQYIKFQNGPIRESGPNGISNEALLAIVADRLEGFQSGQYACRENAIALTKIQLAMHWLHHRTRDRVQRGVEGTSEQ